MRGILISIIFDERERSMFLDHLVNPYAILAFLGSHKWSQVVSKFFKSTWGFLDAIHLTTTACYLKMKCQAIWYNKTIIPWLHHSINNHQRTGVSTSSHWRTCTIWKFIDRCSPSHSATSWHAIHRAQWHSINTQWSHLRPTLPQILQLQHSGFTSYIILQ